MGVVAGGWLCTRRSPTQPVQGPSTCSALPTARLSGLLCVLICSVFPRGLKSTEGACQRANQRGGLCEPPCRGVPKEATIWTAASGNFPLLQMPHSTRALNSVVCETPGSAVPPRRGAPRPIIAPLVRWRRPLEPAPPNARHGARAGSRSETLPRGAALALRLGRRERRQATAGGTAAPARCEVACTLPSTSRCVAGALTAWAGLLEGWGGGGEAVQLPKFGERGGVAHPPHIGAASASTPTHARRLEKNGLQCLAHMQAQGARSGCGALSFGGRSCE